MSKKIEDQELTKRRADHIAKEQADAAMGMTIADRLTRRAKQQTTKISLEDDLGKFEIEMQQPTRRQLDDLLKLKNDIKKKDNEIEANKKLNNVLANLCIDDSLNVDYWNSGDYSLDDLVSIVDKLFESLVEKVNAAQSFRKDSSRAGAVSDVRVPGETPP